MPFTLAHPAVVLPLLRTPLVPSALVAGAMAPDLPYYVSLQWLGGDYNLTLTHESSSVLWLDPIIGLVLLATFQLLLKSPLLALLPPSAAGRAVPAARGFRWRGSVALGLIAVSLVVGAVTHLVWDELTRFPGQPWALRLEVAFSVLGGVALLGWLARWWGTTPPQPVPDGVLLPRPLRTGVAALLAAVAVVAGAVAAARRLTEIREAYRVDGVVDRVGVAEAELRTFLVEGGTAFLVALVVYAVGWHVHRAFTRRAEQLTSP
ncbi:MULTISPECIES: DUF4184 family protein [unclassified Modestobacter]|uniref:DUF4184 family protein n=1 Tax=unclassified Modestobacter TaxID=2643866 RepID=UPI0022AAFCC4|nr:MULTISPECIES: DUF4184 family protein [unclassified Modestobacter]MCZ2825730.1 DUF4184 family protein [Modestobacter sp. VKM Ac-2981]MCZ2853205.1 DUF4184 family protein [Modestobacter sp. VKM Ac-2982]